MKVNVEKYEKFMKEHQLTKSEFCKKCGISVKTFNNILKGSNPQIMTIVKIADFTGYKVENIFSWE